MEFPIGRLKTMPPVKDFREQGAGMSFSLECRKDYKRAFEEENES